jgi:hypothetical protein
LACSPQLVDAVSGISCCDDPSQPGCGGNGGQSGGGGSGGSGATPASGGASAGGSATLIHRYTFQGDGIDVTDSVGNANGNVFGTVLDGSGSVALADGTPEQYVELPSFILYGLRSATFEAWVTWNGGAGWQRIFDFGEDLTGIKDARSRGRSYLFCTPNNGSDLPKVTFGRPGPNNAATEPTQVLGDSPFPQGVMTHIAVVVDEARNSISLFIDGGFRASQEFTYSLANVYDINSWLGRSHFTVDPGFNGIFHEFRIYNGALDPNQILASWRAGP